MSKARYLGRMTSKGQTTVPKDIRDILGLEAGTLVEWVIDDGMAALKPRKLRAIDLAGMLGKPPNGRHATVEDMDDAIGEAVAERFKRATRQ